MVGKKMEDVGAHGSIFLPTIFLPFKCTTDISADVNMQFNGWADSKARSLC